MNDDSNRLDLWYSHHYILVWKLIDYICMYFSYEQILNITIKPRLGMRLGSAPGYGQA